MCGSEEGYYGNALPLCCREATWNYGRRSPKGIKKNRVTLEVRGRIVGVFEDVDFVCPEDGGQSRRVQPSGGGNGGSCHQNKQNKKNTKWIQQILGDP